MNEVGKLKPQYNNFYGKFHENDEYDFQDLSYLPRAVFPTYTFDVTSGMGAQLFIPAEAITVGLSLLAADNATGTVDIQDGFSYGLPLNELIDKFDRWAIQNTGLLQRLGEISIYPHEIKKNASKVVFLRMISRVYLAKRFDVHLTAKGEIGTDTGLDISSLKLAKSKEEIETYFQKIQALNELLNKVQVDDEDNPKGEAEGENGAESNEGKEASPETGSEEENTEDTVPTVRASFKFLHDRGVNLETTLDEPVVLGYISYDFPLFRGGSTGTPIPTFSRVISSESSMEKSVKISQFVQEAKEYKNILAEIAALPQDVKALIFSRAAEQLGEHVLKNYHENLLKLKEKGREYPEQDAFNNACSSNNVARELCRDLLEKLLDRYKANID